MNRRPLSKRHRETLIGMLEQRINQPVNGIDVQLLTLRRHIRTASRTWVHVERPTGRPGETLPGLQARTTYELTSRGANVARQLVRLRDRYEAGRRLQREAIAAVFPAGTEIEVALVDGHALAFKAGEAPTDRSTMRGVVVGTSAENGIPTVSVRFDNAIRELRITRSVGI